MTNNLVVKGVIAGAIILFMSVALGAFGAHALEPIFDAKQLDTWQKAVDYLALHGLAVLVVAVLSYQFAGLARWWGAVISAFVLGCVLFSGSLLLWTVTSIHWLVFLTPIGGLLFLLGWLLLLFAGWKLRAYQN